METVKINRAELKEKAKAQLGRNIFGGKWMMAVLIMFLASLILSAASFVFGFGELIVGGPILFAVAAIFLKQARDNGNMDVGGLFQGFTKDFGTNFLIFLMQSIFICLWSLLFVIPGIIKSFAYSMAFYIKNDHPDYDWKKCIDESQRIMKGHKWEYFVLQLSFIGWIIVGSLAFGIGTLWVAPYMQATNTQFYEAIKDAPEATATAEA